MTIFTLIFFWMHPTTHYGRNYKIIWPLILCDQLKLTYSGNLEKYNIVIVLSAFDSFLIYHSHEHFGRCLFFIPCFLDFNAFIFNGCATWYPKRKISPLNIPIKINETKSNANHEWNEWQRKNYPIFYSTVDLKSGKLSKMVCFGTNGT